jgi:cytochrome P450
VDILAGIHASRTEPKGDFLEALHQEFAHLDEAQRNLDVTCQILAIHMASQSNLFAAIAWTIVNIAARPNVKTRLLEEIGQAKESFGPDFFTDAKCKLDYLEKCYYESIRIAQQSLTLRLVLEPIRISEYTIVPGYYIATLLSCLNTDTEGGILADADQFLPEQHYDKGGKLKGVPPGAEYSISTFGYGPHSCPGRAFANSAAKAVCGALFDRFDLDVPSKCEIIPSQMGAVGRPVVPPTIPYNSKF